MEPVEVGEQGVILVEDFAEAEAGVEHDGLAGDAGSEGGAGAGFEVAALFLVARLTCATASTRGK